MSLVMGIDAGGTNTHGVLMSGKRITGKCEIPGNSPRQAAACFSSLAREKKLPGLKIAVTGGGARKIRKAHLGGRDFCAVDEIEAIGSGGVFLSGKRDVFVVSMGTGTAFVSVRNGVPAHLGGTGIGGGTVKGLSGIMLGTDPGSAEKLAKKARYALDVKVGDIVGKGIGMIPENATAANFGKAHGRKGAGNGEIAGSMFRMVAESVGVMSFFAARTEGQEKDILLCGRVAINRIVRDRILYTIGMFGGKGRVPKNAEYCAAIGAALSV